MRLTKEEFCTAVDRYEEMCAEENKIVSVLGINYEWKIDEWLQSYYNLITDMCDFEEDSGPSRYENDLDYYCYDLNFGKKWKPGMIEIDGKDIPCRNAEELWALITDEGLME